MCNLLLEASPLENPLVSLNVTVIVTVTGRVTEITNKGNLARRKCHSLRGRLTIH